MSRIPVAAHPPHAYEHSPLAAPSSPSMAARPQSRSAYSQSGSSYLSTSSTVPSTPPASSDGLAETRKRQSKRDEVSPVHCGRTRTRRRDGSFSRRTRSAEHELQQTDARPVLQAIRKKIEGELSRKRPGSKRGGTSGPAPGQRSSRPKQGTVSALRPLPALTVPHGMSVSDASQLCAAKRTDCVLVVDEDEHLCGIFTAKDLAFRVRISGVG